MSGPVKAVKTKLFIGNLDQSTQSGELSDLFSPYGHVLEASVIKDYGFVHYGSVEEAEKAIRALNNQDFHGKRLRVELSTSTVRHRPGQPEPASALRHSSRARATGKNNMNGASTSSRYSSSGGAGGPMRRNNSAWARNDVHPYDNVSVGQDIYERNHHYDDRPDPRHYYDRRSDTVYDTSYDAPPRYPGGGPPPRADPYRDFAPPPRADDYGPPRSYDRHMEAPIADPYYGGRIPEGRPPPPLDPYENYDPYQKYYASRPRDPEFPAQHDYDVYTHSRNDLYRMGNGQGQVRRDLPTNLPAPLPPPPSHPSGGIYSSSHRQHHGYSGSSSHLGQYYGAQQR